jgi:hypothetical protein
MMITMTFARVIEELSRSMVHLRASDNFIALSMLLPPGLTAQPGTFLGISRFGKIRFG